MHLNLVLYIVFSLAQGICHVTSYKPCFAISKSVSSQVSFPTGHHNTKTFMASDLNNTVMLDSWRLSCKN